MASTDYMKCGRPTGTNTWCTEPPLDYCIMGYCQTHCITCDEAPS